MNRFDEFKQQGNVIANQILGHIEQMSRYMLDSGNPDSILISQDLYRELKYSSQFFDENPTHSETPTIFGLNVFIIANKTNYINCLILGD